MPPEDYSAEIFWHYVEGVPTVWDELSGAKVSACTEVEDCANGYINYLGEDTEMIAEIESVRDNAITAINNAQTAVEAKQLALEAMIAMGEILEALN